MAEKKREVEKRKGNPISYYDYNCGQNSSIIYDMDAQSLETENKDDSFLYNILLPAWFDGIGNRSSFSMDDLGPFVSE